MVTMKGPFRSVTLSATGGDKTLHHAVVAFVGDDVVSSSINGRVTRALQFRERRPSGPRVCHSGAVVGVGDEGTPLHMMVERITDNQQSGCINGARRGIV